MSVNRLTIIGRLGADPETATTEAGTKLARLSIATERGGDSEAVDWHRCTAWDRLAEVCDEYLSKGDRVYVTGPLTYSRWEDDAGQQRKTAELQVRRLEILGSAGGRKPTKSEKQVDGATAGDSDLSDFSDDALMGDDDSLPF